MRPAVVFVAIAAASVGCGDRAIRPLHDGGPVDASVDRDAGAPADAAMDAEGTSTPVDGAAATDAAPDVIGSVDPGGLTPFAPVRDVVQGCEPDDYVDRRAPDADRELAWSHGFGQDPERCLVVRVGQTVRWRGSLSTHPLDAEGGDQPNPIALHLDGVVRFDRAGTFGYICGALHSGMEGAVHVVP